MLQMLSLIFLYLDAVKHHADFHISSSGTSYEVIHSSSLISILGTFHDPRGYLPHNHVFMLLIIHLLGNSAYIITIDI